MTDETKIASADAVFVATDAKDDRRKALEKALDDRKAHLAELEKRVARKEYSPTKRAQYRAALARASAEVKQLVKEIHHGDD